MKKRKVLKVLCIIIVLVVLLVGSLVLISQTKINNSKKQTAQFIQEYNQLVEKEKVSYVMVEINPKAMLEVVDNKITNMKCLNSDCEDILTIDIKGKELVDAIELIYETSKNKGIDVSKGVNVSSTNIKIEDNVKTLKYVNYKKLTENEEKEYFDKFKDKDEKTENITQENFNNKLYELYKKDPDYGKVYTCNMKENKLKCYITEEFERNLPTQISITNMFYYNELHQKLMNVLDKFNIEYENWTEDVEGDSTIKTNEVKAIKLPDAMHQVGVSYYIGDNFESNFDFSFNIVIDSTLEAGDYGWSYKTLPLSKLELISLTYKESDIVILKNYHSVTASTGNVEETTNDISDTHYLGEDGVWYPKGTEGKNFYTVNGEVIIIDE